MSLAELDWFEEANKEPQIYCRRTISIVRNMIVASKPWVNGILTTTVDSFWFLLVTIQEITFLSVYTYWKKFIAHKIIEGATARQLSYLRGPWDISNIDKKNLCKDLLHEIIIKYNGGNKRGQFFHVLKALYLNFSALSSKHFRRVYNFITMTILNLKPLYRIRCSMNVVPAGALASALYLGTKSEQAVWYL